MKFFKLATVLTVAAVATAIPTSRGDGQNVNLCCSQLQSSSNPLVGFLFGLLNIPIGDAVGQVGLQCAAVNVLSLSQGNCNTNKVSCKDSFNNNLIGVGCIQLIG